VYIYVAYKTDDRFCSMQPYSIKVIDLKEILVYK